MALSNAQIRGFAGKYLNGAQHNQLVAEAKTVNALGVDKKARGQSFSVHIHSGFVGGVTGISDNGSLADISDVHEPEKQEVLPVYVYSDLNIPWGEAQILTGKNSFDRIKEAARAKANTMTCHVNRRCLDGYVSAVSIAGGGAEAIAAGAISDVEIADFSGTRPGMEYDLVDNTGTKVSLTATNGGRKWLKATGDLVPSSTGGVGGTASFTTDTSNNGTLVQDGFYLRVAGDLDSGFASLSDIAGSSSLYGETISNNYYKGTTISAGNASLDDDHISRVEAQLRALGGKMPDMCIISPSTLSDKTQGLTINVFSGMGSDRFNTQKGWADQMVGSSKAVVDELCPNRKTFVLKKKAVVLAAWHDGTDKQSMFYNYGDNSKGLDHDDDFLRYRIRSAGAFQLLALKRSQVGMVNNINY